jgi:type VI secretion system secreted protein VgrG
MATQDHRFASVTTPLDKDMLLFYRLSGTEEVSRLFEYEVDLLMDSNNAASIRTSGFPINKVLGQAMIVTLSSPTGNKRYFHGLVTQFRHHGTLDDFYLYRAVLRPWLWFLTRTSNCRIFQNVSVSDIIKKVFTDHGFSDFKLKLTKSYPVLDYCVQYRETDFDFVSRLMENEGIFYFFEHSNNAHLLIIADSYAAFQSISGYDTIPFFPPENTGQRKQDHIFEWHTAHQVQAGTYVLNDYDFEKPKSSLIAKFTEKMAHNHADGERYDYPGNYVNPPVGDNYANIRLDELQTEYQFIQGKGNALGLTTGMLFSLKDHEVAPENTKHIITSANFTIVSNQYRSTSAEETHYECDFKAIRSTQRFRPQRSTPVPFVQGPQTATVVGKDGEEIWTDKYGRIKVQFHWDRDGKNNENSSCWVRVATPVAGKKWGWVSLPRIGQEVVVSFLEGNPNRPLITGSVYNADQMPPYALPANQTQSGIKSRSSKEGVADNFNEIRFEDKKDSEELYVHAEKDFNCVVENNETRKIGLDKKDAGNQTLDIYNHRTATLKMGNDTLTVEQGNRETNVNTGNNSLNVKTGNCSTKVNLGNYTLDVDAGQATITAMTSIELKVGSNSVKIDQMGVTIKGLMIKAEAEVQLDAKGLMTTVNADVMLTLKGAITMIN